MKQTDSEIQCSTCSATAICFPAQCEDCLMKISGGNFAEEYQAALECDDIEIIPARACEACGQQCFHDPDFCPECLSYMAEARA
jgi:hypothetical protein